MTEQILLYIGIGVATIVVTMLFLLVTKIRSVVTLGCGLVIGALIVLLARIDLGFWDPLAPVAFVANAAFAFVVSIAFVTFGRAMRWPFFLPKPAVEK